jgi:3-mercaptopyruvate sulfurtransferase SseA
VCYDGTGGARPWWVLARFGHQDVRFLNGGFRHWIAGGLLTSTETVQPHPTTYHLGVVQDRLVCNLTQTEAHVHVNDVLWGVCGLQRVSRALRVS